MQFSLSVHNTCKIYISTHRCTKLNGEIASQNNPKNHESFFLYIHKAVGFRWEMRNLYKNKVLLALFRTAEPQRHGYRARPASSLHSPYSRFSGSPRPLSTPPAGTPSELTATCCSIWKSLVGVISDLVYHPTMC